eukprot:jgi/Chlat1/192/Chrsp1S03258
MVAAAAAMKAVAGAATLSSSTSTVFSGLSRGPRQRSAQRGQRAAQQSVARAALAEAKGPHTALEVVKLTNKPTTSASPFSVAVAEPATGVVSVGRNTLANVTAVVADDLAQLHEGLMAVVGNRHPVLMQAAEQIFKAGGKRIRPALVFLASRATSELAGLSDIRWQHRRLAEVIEMIHTASLVHDDVLDEAATRRGVPTVHKKFGTRVAVLVGDYLFSQSSRQLAYLENLEVIKLISEVIASFADGEIAQAQALFNVDLTMEEYLDKSFYKTASLVAAATKSAAIFSDVGPEVSHQMYEYGRHLGLAFQIVDDILDFTQSTEQLGKPAGSDLASGNLTAPALFAMQREPLLREIIESEFQEEGSLDEALRLIEKAGGIAEARALARQEGELAWKCLQCLPVCDARRGLEGMVEVVLERMH